MTPRLKPVLPMDDKIKALWANNKILFFLLLPLVLLAIFRNVLISLLVSSGNKIVSDSTAKSDELKTEADKANTQANQIIADADKKSEDKPTVTEDWNKK